MLAMSALGVPWLTRRCYAAFFRVHVIMAAATLVGVAFHGFGAAVAAGIMPLAIPGGLLWLLDIALRAVFGTRAPPTTPQPAVHLCYAVAAVQAAVLRSSALPRQLMRSGGDPC